MANQEIGNPHGHQVVSGTNRSASQDLDNLDTIAAMRARLQVIDAGLYTDAYLNTMTKNDMVYAIRVNDAASTVK